MIENIQKTIAIVVALLVIVGEAQRPDTCAAFEAQPVSATSVVLAWNEPSTGAPSNAYVVKCCDHSLHGTCDDQAHYEVVDRTLERTLDLTELVPGSTHTCQCAVWDTTFEKSWSFPTQVTFAMPAEGRPDTCASFEASPTSPEAAVLTWTEPASGIPVDAYVVSCCDHSVYACDKRSHFEVVDRTLERALDVPNLTASSTYTCQCAVWSTSFESAWSFPTEATFTTPSPKVRPDECASFTASPVSSTAAILTWSEPLTGAPSDAYVLSCCDNSLHACDKNNHFSTIDRTLEHSMEVHSLSSASTYTCKCAVLSHEFDRPWSWPAYDTFRTLGSHGDMCSSGSACDLELSCIFGECQLPPPSCASNDECVDGTCVEGYCIPLSSIGGPCDPLDHSDCVGATVQCSMGGVCGGTSAWCRDDAACSSGVCNNEIRLCAPLPIGSACRKNSECDTLRGETCLDGVCSEISEKGMPCDVDDNDDCRRSACSEGVCGGCGARCSRRCECNGGGACVDGLCDCGTSRRRRLVEDNGSRSAAPRRVSTPTGHRAQAQTRPPNIVVVLADDMGRADLPMWNDQSPIRTPRIDAFRAQGMRFDDAHTMGLVCSPTRASLLTGRHPATMNIRHPLNSSSGRGITQEFLVTDALHKAGYTNLFAGKWHLSPNDAIYRRRTDAARFDKVVEGISCPSCIFYNMQVYMGFNDTCADVTGTPWEDETKHTTEVYADLAARLIDEHMEEKGDEAPFFLALNVFNPHDTPTDEVYDAPARHVDDCATRTDTAMQARYCGVIQMLDEQFGSVLDYLERRGLDNNTLVVFLSDNGPQPESRWGVPWSVGQHAGMKKDPGEAGHLTPLLMRLPGVIAAGSTTSRLVGTHDFLPTFSEVAGVDSDALPAERLQGSSFWGVASGADEQTDLDDRVLTWEAQGWMFTHPGCPIHPGESAKYAVRRGDWKLVNRPEESPALTLYNLTSDPYERNDLSTVHPDVLESLNDDFYSWRLRENRMSLVVDPVSTAERTCFTGDRTMDTYEGDLTLSLSVTRSVDSTLALGAVLLERDEQIRIVWGDDGHLRFEMDDHWGETLVTTSVEPVTFTEGIETLVTVSVFGRLSYLKTLIWVNGVVVGWGYFVPTECSRGRDSRFSCTTGIRGVGASVPLCTNTFGGDVANVQMFTAFLSDAELERVTGVQHAAQGSPATTIPPTTVVDGLTASVNGTSCHLSWTNIPFATKVTTRVFLSEPADPNTSVEPFDETQGYRSSTLDPYVSSFFEEWTIDSLQAGTYTVQIGTGSCDGRTEKASIQFTID